MKVVSIPFRFKGRHPVWKSAVGEAWATVSRFSEDALRLSRIVRNVCAVRMAPGDVGEWRPWYPNPTDPSQVSEDNKDGPGDIWLNRMSVCSDPVMAVLHEMGHAATTEEDIYQRHAPTEGWASESSADYYAAKWAGLDRLRKRNSSRDHEHHGGIPGQKVLIYDHWYNIDERFVFHPSEPH